ncbi:PQQ-dependent sugar dehydrogenase [Pseudomonadota bacterium]
MTRILLICVAWSLGCMVSMPGSTAALNTQPQALSVDGQRWVLNIPSGTQLELLTTEMDSPRLMTFLPNGDLLVGSRSGNIYRVVPPYTDPVVLVHLPDYPHSVAYRDGELLIAQTDGLYSTPYQPGQAGIDEDNVDLIAPLPMGGGHNSRTVAIGPDGRVYVSLGISGNCSDEYISGGYPFDRQRGGVMVLDESTAKKRLLPFATGLRNPVGMDWHPVSKILHASNNGPDHLGFEQPPEYFSALKPDSFHGMPWFQYDGKRLQRDACIATPPPRPAEQVTLPVATFPARNAPMGVAFVPENALDARFTHNAIVAFKGSWGTKPTGGFIGSPATRRPPRLMMVRFEDGNTLEALDIISGFQRADGKRLARPVGVMIGPDGALYFTSDSATEGLFRLSILPSRH